MHHQHAPLIRRKPKKRASSSKFNDTPLEWKVQQAFCDYMQLKQVVYFAIPNDGNRSPAMAAKAAATGLQKGMPDLMIPMPRGSYHGLFLELKREKGGTVSEWQQYWIDMLRYQGYRAEVVRGLDAAITTLEHYLNGSL